MYRFALSLLLIAGSFAWAQSIPTPSDVSTTLSQAENHYFETRFREAISLLLPVDAALQTQTDRIKERTSIKLQLALAHIALNQTAEARTRFAELDDLDPGFALDPLQFPPKVIELFLEARADRSATRCRTICDQADRDVQEGRLDELAGRLRAAPSCTCMSAVGQSASDLAFRQGLEAYKQDQLAEASIKLRTALAVNPKHDLAGQYLELISNKVELTLTSRVAEWRAAIEARDYPRASANYRQTMAVAFDPRSKPVLDEMQGYYRQALDAIAKSWNQACASNDTAAVTRLKTQATALLPDASMGKDILDQMNSTCEAPGCVQMPMQSAMVRLKTRVNPDIPNLSRRQRPLNVRAKVRIDEAGDVTVLSIEGGPAAWNDAVKTALEKWKFLPAVVGERVRCVETELPIFFN